jgi:hypothetical protein
MLPIHRRIPLVAFAIASSMSVAASAQGPMTGAAAVGCTYATCAIRIERGVFAERLVRGATGERVSTLGGFGDGVDVLLGGSDSAVVHVQAYKWNAKRSALLGVAGSVALGVVLASTHGFYDSHATNADAVAGIAGLVALVSSVPFEVRARRELARAIWWYNGSLPR